MHKVQIRPDSNVIIANTTAKEYIESVSPSLENLVAKFYEILPRSGEYTGYTVNAELGEFFNKLICKTCEPVAISGNVVKKENPEDISSDKEGSSKSEGSSSESGDSGNSGGSSSQESKAISAKNGIQNIGIAAFKYDKLVGTLTAEETLAHLLLTNELKSCNISIQDPEDESKNIDLYIHSNYIEKFKVSIINGNPYIKTSLVVNARIASSNNMSQEMTEERLAQIEQSASVYLKKLLTNYLYKTSKEFHSDIAGFGKYALKEFKTNDEFNEYNWPEHYQDSFFEVNTRSNNKIWLFTNINTSKIRFN